MAHSILLGFLSTIAVYAGEPSSPFPIDASLEGPQSSYTQWVGKVLKDWPALRPSDSLVPEQSPVKMRCYDTPGNPFSIGVGQWMTILAPLAEVQKRVENFEEYPIFMDGLVEVKVESREANRVVTRWEQSSPAFFIPNIKFKSTYLMDLSRPTRKIFRYQLKSSEQLIAYDGLIVLESVDATTTRFTEFDFWDAHWGLAKSFGQKKIWSDSIEGLFLSDMAIKLKSEHPDWDRRAILEAGRRALKSSWLTQCIEGRVKLEIQ